MKALVVIALLCALIAGALFWPVGGRSFWQRADERGLPHATARLAARGLRSAWDLVFTATRGSATPADPAHSPAPVRHVSRKTEHARAGAADRPAGPDRAPASDRIPERTASLAAGPDRIVAQPAKETLQQNDRAGLDKLVRAR